MNLSALLSFRFKESAQNAEKGLLSNYAIFLVKMSSS